MQWLWWGVLAARHLQCQSIMNISSLWGGWNRPSVCLFQRKFLLRIIPFLTFVSALSHVVLSMACHLQVKSAGYLDRLSSSEVKLQEVS